MIFFRVPQQLSDVFEWCRAGPPTISLAGVGKLDIDRRIGRDPATPFGEAKGGVNALVDAAYELLAEPGAVAFAACYPQLSIQLLEVLGRQPPERQVTQPLRDVGELVAIGLRRGRLQLGRDLLIPEIEYLANAQLSRVELEAGLGHVHDQACQRNLSILLRTSKRTSFVPPATRLGIAAPVDHQPPTVETAPFEMASTGDRLRVYVGGPPWLAPRGCARSAPAAEGARDDNKPGWRTTAGRCADRGSAHSSAAKRRGGSAPSGRTTRPTRTRRSRGRRATPSTPVPVVRAPRTGRWPPPFLARISLRYRRDSQNRSSGARTGRADRPR